MKRLAVGVFLLTLATAPLCGGENPGDRLPPGLQPASLEFDELIVQIEPFGMSSFAQTEQLKFDKRRGRCWYFVDGRPGRKQPPVATRNPARFRHELSNERIRQLNRRLKETDWLTAKGGEGRATHTHPTKITLTLKRDGGERKVICNGDRPEPYKALLHLLNSIALQERRIYLHDYCTDEAGDREWQAIRREVTVIGDKGFGPFPIEYERYLPIARRIVQGYFGKSDKDLLTAVRLIGHFQDRAQRPMLHRLAHDRSSNNLRSEVAWALGRIKAADSLPVLATMMEAPASREHAGRVLISWGDPAVPFIVKLIRQSTNEKLTQRERTAGEDMIRSYLDHWPQVLQPVDHRVIKAVQAAVDHKDPANGLVRITYHKEFLSRVAKKPADNSVTKGATSPTR